VEGKKKDASGKSPWHSRSTDELQGAGLSLISRQRNVLYAQGRWTHCGTNFPHLLCGDQPGSRPERHTTAGRELMHWQLSGLRSSCAKPPAKKVKANQSFFMMFSQR